VGDSGGVVGGWVGGKRFKRKKKEKNLGAGRGENKVAKKN
jgi:hypothetical protein